MTGSSQTSSEPVRAPAVVVSEMSKRYVKYDDVPTLVGRAIHFGKNTRRSFIWAVRDASFEIAQGECVGIIGKNGSGKSTLLRMLAGVTAPTMGKVLVNGRVAPLIAVGVGFHPELTGRENVYVNGIVLGQSKAAITNRFDELLEFAGVEDFIDTPVKFYSSGMMVRLGFAVAVMADPDVLLVDEVLAVGDIAFQMKCFERMEQIRESGATVVVVSHNLGAIRRMCERTILIHDGLIRHDGDTGEAISLFHDLIGELAESADDRASSSREIEAGRRAEGIELALLDSNGRPTRHVKAGEDATLRLLVRFPGAVHDALVGVSVQAENGVQVYAETSEWDRAFEFEAGASVQFDARFCVALARGTYQGNLTVASKNGRVIAAPRPVLFYVDGRGPVKGVADLAASIKVTTKEGAAALD